MTMLPMDTGGYRFIEKMDSKFIALTRLFTTSPRYKNIIDWLHDEKDHSYCYQYADVCKEQGVIALYNTLDRIDYEADNYVDCDPTKRFEMSYKNFAEIIYQWEELRVIRPDVILVVIHEDNHVSLETDPVVIKKYQEAGYAFDYNRYQRIIKEYTCFEKDPYTYFSSTGVQSYHCNFTYLVDYIQIKHISNKKFNWDHYKYHNKKSDDFFIGSYFFNKDNTLRPAEHELADHVNTDNSCQISRHNFLDFEEQWLALEKSNSFAVVYKDEQNWICCQGFVSTKEMYDFVMQTVEV